MLSMMRMKMWMTTMRMKKLQEQPHCSALLRFVETVRMAMRMMINKDDVLLLMLTL